MAYPSRRPSGRGRTLLGEFSDPAHVQAPTTPATTVPRRSSAKIFATLVFVLVPLALAVFVLLGPSLHRPDATPSGEAVLSERALDSLDSAPIQTGSVPPVQLVPHSGLDALASGQRSEPTDGAIGRGSEGDLQPSLAAVAPPSPAPPFAAADPPRVEALGPPSEKVASAAAQPPAPAVRGVADTEIRFGISAPFSGSARELGRQMKIGIEIAFNLANDAGGVYGRQLKLISADDGYEPTRTADAVGQLREKHQVLGFIGNVGTPTAAVALPYALEHKLLFLGAYTGANLLRANPPDRYVFNYRASYPEETEAIVRYLVKVRGIRPREIAVFAQQDSYGDAGFSGVAKALRALPGGDARPVLRLNYKRNSIDVAEAVAQLRSNAAAIKAVVMVATYRAAAKFIETTRALNPKMIYTNVSFVGSTALAGELMLLGPSYADGVIVTQVVPAVDGYSKAVLDYKAALAKYFPGEAPDYVSLEGYVAAKILVEGLNRAGPQPDVEKVVDALESIRGLDLGLGTIINFGLSEHQASHVVWGTQLDNNGRFKPIDLD